MIKNTLLFCIMKWRFDRCGDLVEKKLGLYRKATDDKTRMKHLRKVRKLNEKRRQLLDRMYPAYK